MKSVRGAEILLALVILSRSTSYLFSKSMLEGGMASFNLLALRFGAAFLMLAVVFGRRVIENIHRNPGDFKRGAILGTVFFGTMALEMMGLSACPVSMSSLIGNTSVVFVPIFAAVLARRMPSKKTIFSTAITFAGVILLVMKGGQIVLTAGELLLVLEALIYTAVILLTDRFSKEGDALTMGVIEVGTLAVLSLAAAFVTGAPRLPQGGTEWIQILLLAGICTGFGFTLQPVAQKKMSAEKAGMFCALNPMGSAVLGLVFRGETIGLLGGLGMLMILAGIMVSSMKSPETSEETIGTVHSHSAVFRSRALLRLARMKMGGYARA